MLGVGCVGEERTCSCKSLDRPYIIIFTPVCFPLPDLRRRGLRVGDVVIRSLWLALEKHWVEDCLRLEI